MHILHSKNTLADRLKLNNIEEATLHYNMCVYYHVGLECRFTNRTLQCTNNICWCHNTTAVIAKLKIRSVYIETDMDKSGTESNPYPAIQLRTIYLPREGAFQLHTSCIRELAALSISSELRYLVWWFCGDGPWKYRFTLVRFSVDFLLTGLSASKSSNTVDSSNFLCQQNKHYTNNKEYR